MQLSFAAWKKLSSLFPLIAGFGDISYMQASTSLLKTLDYVQYIMKDYTL